MQIQRADGSLIWVVAAGTLLKSSGTPQEIQGMFLSIQELKRKEIELTAAKVQADLASTAKSQFLANMSHELRTPLVGVLGMADIMESSQTTEDQRECLSVIRESAGSLLSLIGKILDYADQNQPGQPPEDETFSLVELVREEMQSARVSANDKGLTLQLSNKLQNDAAYCADARKIHLVVRALVENAVKFTEKGEILVTISSRGRSPRAEFIRLSVCDTGIGISPEFHEAIFEPFSQADDSNSRRFGGAGIGLSLARESARSLGGEILLESALGSGSTFMLDIALRRDHSTYADRDESISASATK
jgi:signal transduction histidine kinase